MYLWNLLSRGERNQTKHLTRLKWKWNGACTMQCGPRWIRNKYLQEIEKAPPQFKEQFKPSPPLGLSLSLLNYVSTTVEFDPIGPTSNALVRVTDRLITAIVISDLNYRPNQWRTDSRPKLRRSRSSRPGPARGRCFCRWIQVVSCLI